MNDGEELVLFRNLVNDMEDSQQLKEILDIWEAVPSEDEIEEMYKAQYEVLKNIQDNKH